MLEIAINSSSIRTLLEFAIQRLAESSTPRLDAEIILSHALNKPRSFLYACPEYEPSSPQRREFEALLQRRVDGEPVAYLRGEKEFWSLPLRVSRDTLIPRPETETLVAAALELGDGFYKSNSSATPGHAVPRAIDLGTGSGCIALALAHERPHWEISAADSSLPALRIAQANAEALRIKNIRWLHSDWFSNVNTNDSFDLIISNPPYIPVTDPHLQRGDVRFEPRAALIGGDDGLEAITGIARQSRARMHAQSRLLLEIGHDQAERVRELLTGFGYTDIEFRRDLNNIDRVCIARFDKQ